jgi:hypothetical protein
MNDPDFLFKRRTAFPVQRGGDLDDVEKRTFIWKTVVGSNAFDDTNDDTNDDSNTTEACLLPCCKGKRSAAMWKGTALLVVNTVGMGLFTIPGVFRDIGILPATLVLFLTGFAGLASTYFLLVGLESHYRYTSNNSITKKDLPTRIYGDIVQFAIESKIITSLFSLGLVIDLAGGLAGYFNLILVYFRVFAQHLFQDGVAADRASLIGIVLLTAIYVLITIVVACKRNGKCGKQEVNLPSCLKKGWDHFVNYSPFVATVLITILLIVEFTRQRRTENTELLLKNAGSFFFARFGTLQSFVATTISTLPVLAMAYLNQHVILQFVYDMYQAEDNREADGRPIIYLSSVLSWTWNSISFAAAWYTQIATFALYVTAGLFGYMAFQDKTDDNIIVNAPLDPLWIIARLLSMMAIILGCIPASGDALSGIIEKALAFVVASIRNALQNCSKSRGGGYDRIQGGAGPDEPLPGWLLPLLQCILYLISTVSGIFAPNLKFIYAIVGSLVDSWIMFIMPPVCFFVLRRSLLRFNPEVPRSSIIIGIAVICFGGIIWLLGGFTSIASYVSALKDLLDRFPI